MNLAQVSSQVWTALLPAMTKIAVIIGVLLVTSFLIIRWRRVAAIFRRFVIRRSRYDYRSIFQNYLERFNAVTQRHELYPAILAATCRIIGINGSSLIVRDARDRFQMKATHGLRPFSFDIEEFRPFLDWLEEAREVVAREDFVRKRELATVKNVGLRYFVQSNAEAAVPLFVGDKLYGVINLGGREDGDYDGETRDLLKLLAVQFTTAIHNANLYEALVKQNKDLQETSKLKTQLLANLSHELRTPLTSIIGLAELLAEGGDGEVNAEQIEHLSMIRGSGVRLLETVTAIFDLSKLEVNKLDLEVQRVKLDRLVENVAKTIQLNKYTKFEINLDSDTPGVYGDEARITAVMKQLLGNAAKFTRHGKITVNAEKCGEMLKVTVKDTGVGIPPDRQKAIFDGFVQADGGITRPYQGLGLGLTISKKLVELHGGRMWLTSKVNKGSEFSFTLPLKPVGAFGNDQPR